MSDMNDPGADAATPKASGDQDLKADIQLTHIIYGLMAGGFVTGGLGSLGAIIVNYVKLGDVKGTWLESHFRWQIRTFWWGLLWGLLCIPLMFIIVGLFLIWIDVIWIIYRIAKGWISLNDSKPMYS